MRHRHVARYVCMEFLDRREVFRLNPNQTEGPILIVPWQGGTNCPRCGEWVDKYEGKGVCKCGFVNRKRFKDLPLTPLSEPVRPEFRYKNREKKTED